MRLPVHSGTFELAVERHGLTRIEPVYLASVANAGASRIESIGSAASSASRLIRALPAFSVTTTIRPRPHYARELISGNR